MITAMQELIEAYASFDTLDQFNDWLCNNEQSLIEKEKEQMVDFYTWIRLNDTPENAKQYCHYSDQDMLTEYLNQNK